MLATYAWPGNVRELRNALERAIVFSHGDTLEPADFPDNIRAAASGAAGSIAWLRSLEDVEREVIVATLEATHYKISRAAEALGIAAKLSSKNAKNTASSENPPAHARQNAPRGNARGDRRLRETRLPPLADRGYGSSRRRSRHQKTRRGPRCNSGFSMPLGKASLPRPLQNGSANFASRNTRDIFVCGDADGFPAALRERVPQKISLSPMTYSHELARAMLVEQLYRAFAILSGSPYPK